MWQLPDTAITPETVYRDRRQFLKTLGFGLAAAAVDPAKLLAATTGFPGKTDPNHRLSDLKPTRYEAITGYNNFIEFARNKEDARETCNQGWNTSDWTLEITGLVQQPLKFSIDDLVKAVGGLEQRNYRFRCVEAWSMVIPWDGFPLARLLALASPKPEACYVKFVSFLNPGAAPYQRDHSIPWPYTEGLTLSEAMNELTLLATGIYGKPLSNQNGAPIRLVVPWKYGFKSIKSVTRIELTAEQPATLWNKIAPDEYGFYANINPTVDHPRWSQARETVIGGGIFSGKKDTLIFNGYEAQVASLYQGLDLRTNF